MKEPQRPGPELRETPLSRSEYIQLPRELSKDGRSHCSYYFWVQTLHGAQTVVILLMVLQIFEIFLGKCEPSHQCPSREWSCPTPAWCLWFNRTGRGMGCSRKTHFRFGSVYSDAPSLPSLTQHCQGSLIWKFWFHTLPGFSIQFLPITGSVPNLCQQAQSGSLVLDTAIQAQEHPAKSLMHWGERVLCTNPTRFYEAQGGLGELMEKISHSHGLLPSRLHDIKKASSI